jgi:alpha-L-fucosidase
MVLPCERRHKVKSPEKLFDLYLHSVGNGGNLLLNVPPDRTGRINAADSAALMGFKQCVTTLLQKMYLAAQRSAVIQAIKKHTCTARSQYQNLLGIMPSQENTDAAHNPSQKNNINSLALEEMLAYGQRVIDFTIEAFDGKEYKVVYKGTTIGRKKIAVFKKQQTDRLRVTIHHAKAAPVLRGNFGVFDKRPCWIKINCTRS